MKMFGNLTKEGLEESGDRLGGGALLESGVYTGIVTLAYAGKSQATGSDAQFVTVHVKVGNTELRETHYVTTRAGDNSYPDKKDASKKHPLPGFTNVDDLCLVTTGFGLADQEMEEKVVNLYDFEKKADVPTNVPVLTSVLGKEVTVAVLKQTVDKQKKNDAGDYKNTGETRDQNIADKFFHSETRRTVTEIKQGIEEAIFIDAWEAKNSGKTINKAKGGDGKAGAPGAPGASAGAAAQKPKTSLFGAKPE